MVNMVVCGMGRGMKRSSGLVIAGSLAFPCADRVRFLDWISRPGSASFSCKHGVNFRRGIAGKHILILINNTHKHTAVDYARL